MEPEGSLRHSHHLSLSWASSIQSIPPTTSWGPILVLSSHLRLDLPSVLFPSDFPSKILDTPLLCTIRATLERTLIQLKPGHIRNIPPLGLFLMFTYDIHRREEGQIRVSSRVCVIWERAECGFLQYVGEGSQVVVMREKHRSKCLPHHSCEHSVSSFSQWALTYTLRDQWESVLWEDSGKRTCYPRNWVATEQFVAKPWLVEGLWLC